MRCFQCTVYCILAKNFFTSCRKSDQQVSLIVCNRLPWLTLCHFTDKSIAYGNVCSGSFLDAESQRNGVIAKRSGCLGIGRDSSFGNGIRGVFNLFGRFQISVFRYLAVLIDFSSRISSCSMHQLKNTFMFRI